MKFLFNFRGREFVLPLPKVLNGLMVKMGAIPFDHTITVGARCPHGDEIVEEVPLYEIWAEKGNSLDEKIRSLSQRMSKGSCYCDLKPEDIYDVFGLRRSL